MKNGNAVAIALAALAVVIAGAGTAVAVTSTTTISDPDNATRIAHVDSSGRLTTAGPMTTINALSYDYPSSSDSVQQILSPTKASLAITELVYDNSLNLALANNNFTVSLVKIAPGSSGNCSDADATWTVLRRDGVRMGDSMSSSLPAPIVVKASGSALYCIGTVTRFSSTAAASSYPVSVTIGAYAVSGNYSGAGATAKPATVTPKVQVNR